MCHYFVETVVACIQYILKNNLKKKEMMPMKKKTNNFLGNFTTKAASCAAYLITILLTKNASMATVLHFDINI